MAVGALHPEAGAVPLLDADRRVPGSADVLILEHHRGRDDVARRVMEAVRAGVDRRQVAAGAGPPHARVRTGEVRLRGRQVGIDVVDAVEVRVIDRFERAGEAAGQLVVDGDVRPPDLRKAEIVVDELQVVARRRSARRVERAPICPTSIVAIIEPSSVDARPEQKKSGANELRNSAARTNNTDRDSDRRDGGPFTSIEPLTTASSSDRQRTPHKTRPKL